MVHPRDEAELMMYTMRLTCGWTIETRNKDLVDFLLWLNLVASVSVS
jgi:hypothetical protein